MTGFEPAASWSQTRRSSQAEPHPVDSALFCSRTTLDYYIKNSLICQQGFWFFVLICLRLIFLHLICLRWSVLDFAVTIKKRSLLPSNLYCFCCDSREIKKEYYYCRFSVLSGPNFSRVSWFSELRLPSSYGWAMKTAVYFQTFPFPTVFQEKSCFGLAVWKFLFGFCTVILCCPDSRNLK